MADNDDKIKELKEKIKQMEEEKELSQIAKYNYLIGRYFHRAHTSWEKITAIDYVDYDEYDGDEIHFECINIYYDDRGDEYNRKCYISMDSYGSLYAKDIEQQETTEEKFRCAFEGITDFIKSKI